VTLCVIPTLVVSIHVLYDLSEEDVDGREIKPGHDEQWM
jgi:hypothetical protein